MVFDIDKIRRIFENLDYGRELSNEELRDKAFCFANSYMLYTDDDGRKRFFNTLKNSSYSTPHCRHITDIILRHPSMLKKVSFVDEAKFLSCPNLMISYEEMRTASDDIVIDLEVRVSKDEDYVKIKDLNLKDTLIYLRDHYESIVVVTPTIYTCDDDIRKSALNTFITPGLFLI